MHRIASVARPAKLLRMGKHVLLVSRETMHIQGLHAAHAGLENFSPTLAQVAAFLARVVDPAPTKA